MKLKELQTGGGGGPKFYYVDLPLPGTRTIELPLIMQLKQ